MPELEQGVGTIVLFKDRNLNGDALILENESRIDDLKSLKFNDKTSSFVILKGIWRFYEHKNREKQMGSDLGPGIYRWVEDFGIKNHKLSSLECIA